MDNFAITAADAVSRRYKSNDPEAIIAQRAIKIKDIRFCEELLGFYTVLLNCEVSFFSISQNYTLLQTLSCLHRRIVHQATYYSADCVMEYCHDKPICFKSINLLIPHSSTPKSPSSVISSHPTQSTSSRYTLYPVSRLLQNR